MLIQNLIVTSAAQAKESALRRFIIQFLPNKYHASETSADFYCITTMFRIRNLMDNQLFPSSSCTQNVFACTLHVGLVMFPFRANH
mmetsp:Transcript_40406/g.127191  ORF Transcript_40406/g.127191 Transcript_40406/m.127191 type:complete len:86 (-) Transcript_40406:823-1080(-)